MCGRDPTRSKYSGRAPISDRSSLDRSEAIFPLMPLRGGPLGPRLRKWLSTKETGSYPFAEPPGTKYEVRSIK